MKLLVPFLTILFFFAGCKDSSTNSDPSKQVTLTINKTEFTYGEAVVSKLYNNSGSGIYLVFNGEEVRPVILKKDVNSYSSFTVVFRNTRTDILPAGKVGNSSLDSLPHGTYKLKFEYSFSDPGNFDKEIVSEEFIVQ